MPCISLSAKLVTSAIPSPKEPAAAVSSTLQFPIPGAKQLREMRKVLHSVLS